MTFPHNVHLLDGSDRTIDLPLGASGSIAFEDAGTFDYECSVHPQQMRERYSSVKEEVMAEHPDISKGWCCDGRTWTEHAHADGECCQPEGRQIEDLPPEGQRKARGRLDETAR
jgi:hypothetical protein